MYVMATLPAESDAAAVRAFADDFNLGWEAIHNQHVLSQLQGYSYFTTTRAMCDCGTVLGSGGELRRWQEKRCKALPRELAKLRRKGWTETKIARWKQQREKHRKDTKRSLQADSPELGLWVDFLRAVIAAKAARRVGMLLHWHTGGLTTERIDILRRDEVRIQDVTGEVLLNMDHDVLYEFVS